ncbi:hypothetical protein A0H81_12858 [Grifola frondosa]|uniref:Uncharacterized protein n=1 Tax=Grifola frondosa TaxID=5627 RepID=A0A1C7LTI4_GRIFR|nr:hypothetical protein A0H81_12858 [Grifola frondosa]
MFASCRTVFAANARTRLFSSHIAAGVVGGAIVVVGGYTWFHFSGAKKALDASNTAIAFFQKSKNAIKEKTRSSPNDALNFLRNVAKSYAAIIPGAQTFVDAAFDTLDELRESHGEEVNKIVAEAYREVQKILKESSNSVDLETGLKIMEALRRHIGKLEQVGRKAGNDIFSPLAEKYPRVAERLGGGYEELRTMAERKGPEAKKILDDTMGQVNELLSKGYSQDALNQARQLIQCKASQVRGLAQSSPQHAWNMAVQQAAPYLDKLPGIKQLLNENTSKFMSTGADAPSDGESGAAEVFARVKDAAEKRWRSYARLCWRRREKQRNGHLEKGQQSWTKTILGGDEIRSPAL